MSDGEVKSTQEQEGGSETNDEKQKEKSDDDDETLTQVSELLEAKTHHKLDTGSNEKKKFFEEELRRLQKSLKEKSKDIQAPPVQEHVPYCFNALGPYYDTKTAEHVILKTGDNGKLKDSTSQYATRNTAIGLVDPWVSNRMDTVPGEPIPTRKHQPFRENPKKEKKVGEGSTMIPVFPHVDMDTPDLASRKLDYGDVPMLRKELKEKYSSQGKAKVNSDYERTKVDFYRMELHRLQDVHPVNRDNMKAAYFAYLQNTPGSKKAVKECVQEIQKEKQDEEKGDEEETTENDKAVEEEKQEQKQEERQEETIEA